MWIKLEDFRGLCIISYDMRDPNRGPILKPLLNNEINSLIFPLPYNIIIFLASPETRYKNVTCFTSQGCSMSEEFPSNLQLVVLQADFRLL